MGAGSFLYILVFKLSEGSRSVLGECAFEHAFECMKHDLHGKAGLKGGAAPRNRVFLVPSQSPFLIGQLFSWLRGALAAWRTALVA